MILMYQSEVREVRSMYIYRVLFGLLILTIPPIAMAQIVGDRLRVTTTDARFDGYVTAIDSTGIDLDLRNDGSHLVPHADIVLLERYMRTRSYKKEGLLIGAGVGVSAGIIAGLIVDESCEQGVESDGLCDENGWADGRLAASIWGTGLGLGGFIIGALIRKDEWQQIATPTLGNLRFYPSIDIRFNNQAACDVRIGFAVKF